mgnify:FL=1
MNIGLLLLSTVLLILLVIALRRREPIGPIVKRLVEQGAKLIPRMICALIAAGFIAQILPKEAIARYLGPEAGLMVIPLAAGAGLLIPAGPVIAFAVAAVFSKAGASTVGLVTFITSWSIFAAHRILIYELPLLGASFFRMRVLSVLLVPILAGVLAMVVGLITNFGAPTIMR